MISESPKSLVNSQISPSGNETPSGALTVALILLLGVVIRFYVCINTAIINPDGTLYIHQARIFYSGNWDYLTLCGIPYVSIYSIMIAVAYPLFGDWVLAARMISLLFGSLSMVPFYFLVRSFLQSPMASLTLLAFTLTPALVTRSADAVRDPVCWFFSLLGMLFFITQVNGKKYRLSLLFSSLSFSLGAWARIESGIFILFSSAHILLDTYEKKSSRLFFFGIPLIVVGSVAIVDRDIFHFIAEDIFRFPGIASNLISPFTQYVVLRSDLEGLAGGSLHEPLILFLQKARHLVWLVALGTVCSALVNALSYPFFLAFLFGLRDLGKWIREDARIRYLVLSSAAGMILVYLHVLHSWYMDSRFLLVFLLPVMVFVGFGLEKITAFLKERWNIPSQALIAMICLLAMTLSMGKTLQPREADKRIFKELGEFIAESEGPSHSVVVSASRHSLRWLSFYANLYRSAEETLCPEGMELDPLVGDNYLQFIQKIREKGIRYFLWEEKHWPYRKFDLLHDLNPREVMAVKKAFHQDTGRIILFKVM